MFVFKIYYFTTASGRNPVKECLDKTSLQARAKILTIIECLEQFGFHLDTKYLRRMSGTKILWELRIAYSGQQYRIILAKMNINEIVLLNAFLKKTQKTPQKEITIAQKRFEELTRH